MSQEGRVVEPSSPDLTSGLRIAIPQSPLQRSPFLPVNPALSPRVLNTTSPAPSSPVTPMTPLNAVRRKSSVSRAASATVEFRDIWLMPE